MAAFLGIDLGTSFARGTVIDDHGQVLRTGRRALTVSTGENGRHVQDPDEWVDAVRDLLTTLGPCQAFAIGGQMNGFVATDDRGEALAKGLTWLDRRLISSSDDTGRSNAPVVRFAEYLAQEEPAAWDRTRWLLLPKDYVLMRLLGVAVSDRLSWNSVFDLSTNDFKANVPVEVRERVPNAGEITATWDSRWGTVVAGCPDGIAGVIGCGIDHRWAYLLGGTSITIAAFAETPEPSGGIRVSVRLGESWIHVGSSSTGGTTLAWAADALAFADVEDLLDSAQLADWTAAPFFIPYLTGERAPIWDSTLTAGWSGVRSRHDRTALAYSVVESVVFSSDGCSTRSSDPPMPRWKLSVRAAASSRLHGSAISAPGRLAIASKWSTGKSAHWEQRLSP